MAYNKLRKLLGMKPKADKTTSEKGVTTVTDYFPDFSVKEVAEYREDGSQLSVSRYSKGQISEKTDYLVDGGQTFSLYSDGVLTEQTTTRADGEKTVTAFAKGKKTERTTYHPDGRRTVDSFENGMTTEIDANSALAWQRFRQGEDNVLPDYSYAGDRKSTRLNSSHSRASRMPSSA